MLSNSYVIITFVAHFHVHLILHCCRAETSHQLCSLTIFLVWMGVWAVGVPVVAQAMAEGVVLRGMAGWVDGSYM